MWFLTGVWAGWKVRENASDDLADRGDQILADGTDDALAKILVELGPNAVTPAAIGIAPTNSTPAKPTNSTPTNSTTVNATPTITNPPSLKTTQPSDDDHDDIAPVQQDSAQ